MSDEMVPIVMFAAFGVVLSLYFYYRFRGKREIQETVRTAIDKGHELSPDLLAQLGGAPVGGDADLRRGVIGIAIGLGLAAFGLLVDEDEIVRPLIASGALPVIIGLAYLGLWRFTGRRG